MIILLRTVFVLNEDEVNHTKLTLCVSKIRVDNTSKTTLSELLALPNLETLTKYSTRISMLHRFYMGCYARATEQRAARSSVLTADHKKSSEGIFEFALSYIYTRIAKLVRSFGFVFSSTT
jgi:hypothetical protein